LHCHEQEKAFDKGALEGVCHLAETGYLSLEENGIPPTYKK